jgi:hypothetical protein
MTTKYINMKYVRKIYNASDDKGRTAARVREVRTELLERFNHPV